MFYKSGILYKSTLLDEYAKYGVCHGFSCREGGVSTLEHTKSLNITYNLGDSDDVVRKNIDIFARQITENRCGMENTVTLHQIHSANVREIGRSNAGEGTVRERGEDGDGFVTAERSVIPIIKVADCVPILLCGLRDDGKPVISAVHAGWRGTVKGIASVAVEKMLSLGALSDSITAAIGAHIGVCCFEVGENFLDEVREMRGKDFLRRNVDYKSYDKPHADLTSMNTEILVCAGVSRERIDISPDCTCCDTGTYYSHRGMKGVRGTMGAGIAII
ncbi:MAG: polyphenol oxidase family protein [Eubacteriales bacterium]